jgi:hypothetical protein
VHLSKIYTNKKIFIYHLVYIFPRILDSRRDIRVNDSICRYLELLNREIVPLLYLIEESQKRLYITRLNLVSIMNKGK